MSDQLTNDVLNRLKEENKRLSEDLSFERNLNNILENIRNNSLILIQNCKCITNQKTLRVIKQFNSIYTNLKAKQNLLKLNENQNQITITKISSNDKNDNNFKTKINQKLKTIQQKTVKVKSAEVIQLSEIKTENTERVANIKTSTESNPKFSLITEILNLKDKSNEEMRRNTNQLSIIELSANHSEESMASNPEPSADQKNFELKYEDNGLIEFIECEPTLDSLYSDNSQSDEVQNEMFVGPNLSSSAMLSSAVCHLCNEHFGDNKDQLLKHLSNRHKIPSFECDLCEFKTFTDNRLLKHKKVHSTDNPFCCDVQGCDQSFRTEYKLSLHKMQTHSTDRRFSCHLCDYKASKKWNLDGHMSVHSVQKSVKCPFEGCDKWFANRHRLYEHKLYKHSPKRFERFACDWPQCQKVFRQKKTLKRHKKAVHSVE